jgi:hypothetical protein
MVQGRPLNLPIIKTLTEALRTGNRDRKQTSDRGWCGILGGHYGIPENATL